MGYVCTKSEIGNIYLEGTFSLFLVYAFYHILGWNLNRIGLMLPGESHSSLREKFTKCRFDKEREADDEESFER